jgi:hypothetical protein
MTVTSEDAALYSSSPQNRNRINRNHDHLGILVCGWVSFVNLLQKVGILLLASEMPVPISGELLY